MIWGSSMFAAFPNRLALSLKAWISALEGLCRSGALTQISYPLSLFSFFLLPHLGSVYSVGQRQSDSPVTPYRIVIVALLSLLLLLFVLYRSRQRPTGLYLTWAAVSMSYWGWTVVARLQRDEDLEHAMWIPPLLIALTLIKLPSRRDVLAALRVLVWICCVLIVLGVMDVLLEGGFATRIWPTRSPLLVEFGFQVRTDGIVRSFRLQYLMALLVIAASLGTKFKERWLFFGIGTCGLLVADSYLAFAAVVIGGALHFSMGLGSRNTRSRSLLLGASAMAIGTLLIVLSVSSGANLDSLLNGRREIWTSSLEGASLTTVWGLAAEIPLATVAPSGTHNILLDAQLSSGWIGLAIALTVWAMALCLTAKAVQLGAGQFPVDLVVMALVIGIGESLFDFPYLTNGWVLMLIAAVCATSLQGVGGENSENHHGLES